MPPDADLDYSAVEPDRDKEPTEYHYTERRAELLDLVHTRGSPHSLNQTQLGQRYGVSQQQISKDLDVLAEYVADSLGARRELNGKALYERCIRGLLDAEDWRGAAQVQTMYEKWLDRRTGDVSGGDDLTAFDGTESDSYQIVDASDDGIHVTEGATDEMGETDSSDETGVAVVDETGATGATHDHGDVTLPDVDAPTPATATTDAPPDPEVPRCSSYTWDFRVTPGTGGGDAEATAADGPTEVSQPVDAPAGDSKLD